MRMSMRLARRSFEEQVVLLYIPQRFYISVSPLDAQAQLLVDCQRHGLLLGVTDSELPCGAISIAVSLASIR
jgi:hypothetical protein